MEKRIGEEEVNNNGEIVRMCKEYRLSRTNDFFEHKAIYQCIWIWRVQSIID